MGWGTTSQAVTANLTGLVAGTTYYCRVAASNSAGTSKGSIVSFVTTARAPTVTTNAATSITTTGARLNGSVNPNGRSTTAWFEWGTSPTLATFTSTSNQAVGSGTTSQAVTANLTGLVAGTTYYCRVAASNSAGTSKGSIVSFVTTARAPTVTTNAATSITTTGARLNGSVNPNGLATNAWFEWGTSPTLATFTSTSNQAMGSGTTSQPVSTLLSGLTPGTTYYYRVAGTSTAGTSKGTILAVSSSASAGYVAVGDSITAGLRDNIFSDGIGYEPILINLLTASKGYPVSVANAGVSGTTSTDGVASISGTLSTYPTATYFLIMYGSNDAKIPSVPSGMGLLPGEAGYSGSYKDQMQQIVTAVLAAGKTPYLAMVPYTSDLNRSDAAIQEYNVAIDELVVSNGISVTPPDFYTYFKSHQGELADGLHPNGTGYQSMADLWFTALTAP